MIELQRITGTASGEVVQMRTCDINTAGDVWTYTYQHKTQYRGHKRTVFIGPKAGGFCGSGCGPTCRRRCSNPPRPKKRGGAQQHKGPQDAALVRQQTRAAPVGSKSQSRPLAWRMTPLPTAARLSTPSVVYSKHGRRRGFPPSPIQRTPTARNAATHYRREHGLEVARVLLGLAIAITEIYAEADRDRAVMYRSDWLTSQSQTGCS